VKDSIEVTGIRFSPSIFAVPPVESFAEWHTVTLPQE
jgi:hypothetical protein